jgi:hypothetical protein
MTLRRKNLASHGVLVTIYGVALFGAGCIAVFEFNLAGFNTVRAVFFIGSIGAILRTGPRVPVLRIVQDNKYLLWIVLYLLMEQIRPQLDQPIPPLVLVVVRATNISLLLLGYYKYRHEQHQKQATATVKSL